MRSMPLTRDSIDWLKHRCEIEAQNERKPVVLLTGRLLQNRFTGKPVPSCTPSAEVLCLRRHFHPDQYQGYLTTTNRHAATSKVAIIAEGFSQLDIESLHLSPGKPYAVCVIETQESSARTPEYNLVSSKLIYELIPQSQ